MSAQSAPSQGAVHAYAEALFGGCAAALSTLLNHTVTMSPQLTLEPGQPLADVVPFPWFVAQARFTRGLAGGHNLVMPQTAGVKLARLVLGEDVTEPGVVTSDHEDALRDIVNQMLASASSSLNQFFSRPVTLAFAELRRVERVDGWVGADVTIVLAPIVVDGVEHGNIALTIPPSVCADATALLAPAPEGGPADVERTPGLEMILDISMTVTVELGRTRMLIKDILALGPGSVIELDRLAGEPVDLLVNERRIAKGEVVVIDDNFGVRLTQISQPTERLQSLA
jgi:flagellar motor switch protein FliN/FliY